MDDDGRLVSTLLWQEIGENGVRGRPLALETLGELSYVEAAVIKFAGRHVGEGDEERGVSLVLFRRLFGSGQAPDDAAMLDAEARPPAAAAQPAGLHTELWRKFWQIAEDAALAEQYGVRVAQIEAPAMRLRGGQVWEVTLDAAGGLNLRCLSSP